MLDRIALMANYCWLPTDDRKLASWVGGIKPGKDGTEPTCYCKKKWPNWADPGNAAYKAMVVELLGKARTWGKDMKTPDLQIGYENLLSLNAEHTGDCVEAALAGAFAGSRFFPE